MDTLDSQPGGEVEPCALLFARRAEQPRVSHRHLDALPLQAGRLLDRYGCATEAEAADELDEELELD